MLADRNMVYQSQSSGSGGAFNFLSLLCESRGEYTPELFNVAHGSAPRFQNR